MYLVPPMADEPPRDFVDFVSIHLVALQEEAARLTGGPQHADEIYPMALSDVAGHWRRLRWRTRLSHRDAAAQALHKWLAARAKRWRDEQIYEVEVRVLKPPRPAVATPASIALRKAAVLPGTVRRQARPVAEASIAWTYAWRRARWHRIGRMVAAWALVTFAFTQVLPNPPG